jgi:DNA-binding CsgD family transcriptional regulator/PAS domain-containing protein
MSDLERITGLIDDIYDAALDPSLWPQVLRRTLALLGAAAAASLSDAELPTDHFFCALDIDPAFAESYLSRYVQLNPLMQFETGLRAGAMFGASDRPERVDRVDERARSTLRQLAPHFRRAVAIGRALERSESKAAALGTVLERLSAAVVFVDRAGRLVHANEPATEMLRTNEVLSWTDGRPRPRDERAAAHLGAILASARRGRPAPECCALALTHTTQGGESLTIHVLPLSAGTHRQGLTLSAAVAALIVSQQTWDLPQRLQSAARLYALTPAESRVVSVLLAGCTIGAAAKTLGIKAATVKTHLQHVFDKTGTRRQVDLARRIADCARPSLRGAAPDAYPPSSAARRGAAGSMRELE